MKNPSNIYAALVANACHQASMIALVPVLLVMFETDLQVIGAVVGIGLALTAIAVPLWGQMTLVFGVRTVLQAVLGISVLAVLILGLSLWGLQVARLTPFVGFLLFVMARIVYCLTAPAILPLVQSIWAQRVLGDDQLLAKVGRTNAINGIGRIIGNFSVAPLMSLGGGAAGVILMTVPFYLFTLVQTAGMENRKIPTKIDGKRVHSEVKIIGQIWPRLTVALLVQMGVGMIYILVGPLIQRSQTVNPEEAAGLAGICLALSLGAGILSHLMLKPLFAKRRTFSEIVSAVFGAAALVWMAQAATFPAIVMGTALLAASVAAMLSLNTAQCLQDVSQEHAPQAATILSSCQFIGLAVGTVTGGSLGQFSIEITCFLAAGLILSTGLFLVFNSRYRLPHAEALPAHSPQHLKRSHAE